ncbi:MAG: MoaD/ThiS family protein [Thermoplasmata archaeon]
MKVTVRLLPTLKETRMLELPAQSTVQDMIQALGLYPDAWIALRNDRPVPLDDELADGDEIKLIAVVSGG